ncbi:MAG: hypothetical protein HYY17_16670 [Planctomycetes bacterium]|nr:hypothetical protein [Planctomycetota bacterium]
MANNGKTEKRLSDLGRICREDRERWRRIGEYILKSERRWQANDRKLEGMLRELMRLSERMDASWRLLHRHLEGSGPE